MSDPMAGSRGWPRCSGSWVIVTAGGYIALMVSPDLTGTGQVTDFFWDLSRNPTSF